MSFQGFRRGQCDLKSSVLFFLHSFIYVQKQLNLKYMSILFIIIVIFRRFNLSTSYHIKGKRSYMQFQVFDRQRKNTDFVIDV